MAYKKHANHEDWMGNQLLNAKAEIVGALPSPSAQHEGRFVYLDTTNRFYLCDGSAWGLIATDSEKLSGQAASYYTSLDNMSTGSLTAARISDFDSVVRLNRLDQMAAPTAAVSMGSQKLTSLANGTASTDAVTKSQLDAVSAIANAAAAGVSVKAAVRAVATGAVTMSGPQTVDGVSLVAGNRVLVANGSAASNGIWAVAAGAWTRVTDADGGTELAPGTLVAVTEGTANADSIWILTSDAAITIGTTAHTWSKFSSGTTYSASNGISITAGAISVLADPTDATISVTGSGIKVNRAKVPNYVTMAVPAGNAATAINHNLNNQYPIWQVYETTGGAPVEVPFTPSGVNGGTLDFATAPTSNQYTVTFIG